MNRAIPSPPLTWNVKTSRRAQGSCASVPLAESPQPVAFWMSLGRVVDSPRMFRRTADPWRRVAAEGVHVPRTITSGTWFTARTVWPSVSVSEAFGYSIAAAMRSEGRTRRV